MRNQRTATAEPMAAPLRCAIYTRKSTEEGLDQDFNSLDAQRESAESFIASQRQNGWISVEDRYDDGGYSGGTLERPALQRLIQNIEAGKVQCVVVYKIDRLSRSLLDFTRLIDLFDRHGVSFVSVTQQFNTTTSMGRLTLNILLSFAQFEREIIGERIRDKIAASKRKGKFMGGRCVLGYDVDSEKHRLVVNAEEAQVVRHVFERFIATASPQVMVAEFNREGLRTKPRKDASGRPATVSAWSTPLVYRMLHNHLYAGEINHKGSIYPGEHEAIVSRDIWEKAQALLRENDRTHGNRSRRRHDALLRGILRCGHCGCGMTHSYARKRGKQYRYYVCVNAMKNGYAACALKTLSAGNIEQIVLDRLRETLRSPQVVARACREAAAARSPGGVAHTEQDVIRALDQFDILWETLFPAEQARIAGLLLAGVEARRDGVTLTLRPNGLMALTEELTGEGR